MKILKLTILLSLLFISSISYAQEPDFRVRVSYDGTPVNADSFADTTYVQNLVANRLIWSLNGVEAYINENVGIGLTNPAYPLDVSGDIQTSGFFRGDGSLLTGINSDNVYNTDGALTADRTITMSGFELELSDDGGNILKLSDTRNGNAFTVGEVSSEIQFGMPNEPYSEPRFRLASLINVTNGNNSRLGIFTSNSGAASVESITVDNIGRVGFGETTPTKTIDVVGTMEVSDGALFEDAQFSRNHGTDAVVEIVGYDGGGIVGTDNNFPLLFRVNNVEEMRVDGNGNVGIGSQAPLSTLHVNNTTDQGILIQRTDATIVAANTLGGIGFSGTDGGTITADDLSLASAVIYGKAAETWGAGDRGAYLSFHTKPANSDLNTESIEAMVIDHNQRVGIGDNNPQANLHVTNDVRFSDYGYGVESFSATTGVAAGFDADGEFIDDTNLYLSAGEVGIGTSSPASLLDVAGTVTADNIDVSGFVTTAGLSVTSSFSSTGVISGSGIISTGAGSFTGIVTAGTFQGSGANLNSIPTSAIVDDYRDIAILASEDSDLNFFKVGKEHDGLDCSHVNAHGLDGTSTIIIKSGTSTASMTTRHTSSAFASNVEYSSSVTSFSISEGDLIEVESSGGTATVTLSCKL